MALVLICFDIYIHIYIYHIYLSYIYIYSFFLYRCEHTSNESMVFNQKAKVGNLGGFQLLFRMTDPRFWLRKVFSRVRASGIETIGRAYNPYQT